MYTGPSLYTTGTTLIVNVHRRACVDLPFVNCLGFPAISSVGTTWCIATLTSISSRSVGPHPLKQSRMPMENLALNGAVISVRSVYILLRCSSQRFVYPRNPTRPPQLKHIPNQKWSFIGSLCNVFSKPCSLRRWKHFLIHLSDTDRTLRGVS